MARAKADFPPAGAILVLADAEGRLAIRATPNARADAILLPKPGAAPVLAIRVTAAPEDGKANAAILALLAKALGRPRSALALLKGVSGRDKVVQLD
jgi:hypothetical protein